MFKYHRIKQNKSIGLLLTLGLIFLVATNLRIVIFLTILIGGSYFIYINFIKNKKSNTFYQSTYVRGFQQTSYDNQSSISNDLQRSNNSVYFCFNCGTKILEDSRYCGACGVDLNQT